MYEVPEHDNSRLWRANPVLAGLPAHYRHVPYAASRDPGSPDVAARPDLDRGANCQLFAYRELAEFGIRLPDLRSSGL